MLLLVVVPRLVLTALPHWRACRLKRNFPLDLEQSYFRKLVDRLGAGGPTVLRVLPANLENPSMAVSAALFNLAATPENENHGAFLGYLVRHVPRGVAVRDRTPERPRSRRPGRPSR